MNKLKKDAPYDSWVAGLLVPAVLVIALCSCSTPAVLSPPPPTATAVAVMNPFTTAGDPAPDIQLTETSIGSCQQSNIDYGNANARRCFTTDSVVLDPCFVAGYQAAIALCIDDPRKQEALKITITDDLVEPSTGGGGASSPAGQDPWFIQLADGRGCGKTGGATYVVAGMRAAYGCTDQTVLFGSPNQSSQTWTIPVQAEGSSTITTEKIAAVWY